MEYVTRLANSQHGYPLPVTGSAFWRQMEAPQSNARYDSWVTTVDLPGVPAEHIIVPSYAQLPVGSQLCRFQFTLIADGQRFALNPVPAENVSSSRSSKTPASELPAVTCHIDCWHTHTDLKNASVELRVSAHEPPQQYLFTNSIRPLELPEATIEQLRPEDAVVTVPRNISQMTAAKNVRARICSPTALSMALSGFNEEIDWSDTIQACYDPLTKAYGSWPLAIRCASAAGRLAAVEVFHNWDDAIIALRGGSPLVCSIRFDRGGLDNAPLAQTGGHLVVLHGIEGDCVLVKDPAAECDEQVPRRYRVDQFTRAWLQHRGAAYIFATQHQT